MFTGLIEAVGSVDAVESTPGGLRLRIETSLAPALAAGDSLAVNGVCLTATASSDRWFDADLGPETVRVTSLGDLRPGRRVNLERAMRADARVGGHFVQGHADGTGVAVSRRDEGEAHWLTIAYPPRLRPLLIARGSIAVDGVSLTVAALRDESFDVMIIPFTWTHTSLADVPEGARVNLECDMIGKYVVRQIELQRT